MKTKVFRAQYIPNVHAMTLTNASYMSLVTSSTQILINNLDELII